MLRVNSNKNLREAVVYCLRRAGIFLSGRGLHSLNSSNLLKREAGLAAKSMNCLVSVNQKMTQQKRLLSKQQQQDGDIYQLEKVLASVIKLKQYLSITQTDSTVFGFLRLGEISTFNPYLAVPNKSMKYDCSSAINAQNAVQTKLKEKYYTSSRFNILVENVFKLCGAQIITHRKVPNSKLRFLRQATYFAGESILRNLVGFSHVHEGDSREFIEKVREDSKADMDDIVAINREVIDLARGIDHNLADQMDLILNNFLVIQINTETMTIEVDCIDRMKDRKSTRVMTVDIKESIESAAIEVLPYMKELIEAKMATSVLRDQLLTVKGKDSA